MDFSQKLQALRKGRGFTQERLASELNVSRQAIAKWEAGTGYPDVSNLVQLSELLHVTVDYLVKEQECSVAPIQREEGDRAELIAFRLRAARCTYAAWMNQAEATRLDSHDFHYEEGPYCYHDTYVGGQQFDGQEAIWKNGRAVYAMNYLGRVLGETFSGNFLKEALRHASEEMPFRGPAEYQSGEYRYKCQVTGDVAWFQGQEEIWCRDEKVFECLFHGGLMKA